MDQSFDTFISEFHILLSAFRESEDQKVVEAIDLLRPVIGLLLDGDGNTPPHRRTHLRIVEDQ